MTNVLKLPKNRRNNSAAWVEYRLPGGKVTHMVPGEKYLMRRKTTGEYYYRRSQKGKSPFFRPTGKTTIAQARRKGEELWLGHLSGNAPSKKSEIVLVCDVFEELQVEFGERYQSFVENKAGKKRSPRTREKDLQMIPLCTKLFGHMDIRDLNNHWWRGYMRNFKPIVTVVKRSKKTILKRGGPPTYTRVRSTLGDIRKYLCSALKLATEKNYLPYPVRLDDVSEGVQSTPKIYTNEEQSLIVDNFHKDYRLAAILLNEAAPRITEVCTLRWDRNFEFVEHQGRSVTIVYFFETKNKTPRAYPLIGYADQECRKAFEQRDPEVLHVFPQIQNKSKHIGRSYLNKLWNDAARKAGIQGKTWVHWTRQTHNEKSLLVEGISVDVQSARIGTKRATLDRYLAKRDKAQIRQRALSSLDSVGKDQ